MIAAKNLFESVVGLIVMLALLEFAPHWLGPIVAGYCGANLLRSLHTMFWGTHDD